jgi:hypothetical protein
LVGGQFHPAVRFRRSLGASKNGRVEQCATVLEVAGKSAGFGDASTERFLVRLSD